jgi:putative serine protease PepD
VSALRVEDGVHYIQFSAPISPGNSGGPVLDAGGRVIGVSVSKAVATGAEGLSFATPVAEVCSDLGVC